MTSARRGRFANDSVNSRRRVQRQARVAYRLWLRDPYYPSLHFKRVHPSDPIFSVRVGRSWRALGLLREHDQMVWFWIGSRGDYDRLLSQL